MLFVCLILVAKENQQKRNIVFSLAILAFCQIVP